MTRLRSVFMLILSVASLAVSPPPGRTSSPPDRVQLRVTSAPPEANKELSRVPGVSMIRDPRPVEKDWDGGGYFSSPVSGFSRNVYGAFLGSFPAKDTCISYGSLSWTLQQVTGVRAELIFGAWLLPHEGYTMKITGPDLNMEQVRAQLFHALEETFGIRVSQQKRKARVLVLSKGENWNRDGFKTCWWPVNGGGATSKDGKTWDFTAHVMDEIAGIVESDLRRIVLNETGLQGWFRGSMAAGNTLNLTDHQKDLLQHGLLLQEAIREMDVVVVERK
jgi:hypothetical protein